MGKVPDRRGAGIPATRGASRITLSCTQALADLQPRRAAYAAHEKTIPVPLDWAIDENLVPDLVAEWLMELACSARSAVSSPRRPRSSGDRASVS